MQRYKWLSGTFFFLRFIFIYLFILATPGLCCSMWDLLWAMWDLFFFLVVACGLLSSGMHAGSSSPTRDWTQAICIGSAESYPLDHQGSPSLGLLRLRQNSIVPSTWAFWNVLYWHAHSLGSQLLLKTSYYLDTTMCGKWFQLLSSVPAIPAQGTNMWVKEPAP